MEHSVLHALQLLGIVVALGGVFLMLAIFLPALGGTSYTSPLHKKNGDSYNSSLPLKLSATITRWTFRGALFGALAAFLNLFVDVAEVNNQTIFGVLSPHEVWRFATITSVGQLTSARIGMLLFAGLALRFAGKFRWPLAAIFALAAALLSSLVCHAAAQPTGRGAAITLEFIHIVAASLWLGPLIHLLLARKQIESIAAADSFAIVGKIVRRFSPIAFACVVLIFVSGIIAAVRFLIAPVAVTTSAYGLTLMVKLALILPLLYAGWMNFRVIRPLFADPVGIPRRTLLRRFTRMLELEVSAGILVITVAGILASVSPPSDGPALRLTSQQVHALLTPDLPTTAVVNPQKFVGATERTMDDLRYAEFTHNWSGVIVALLGLCWLGQSLRGRAGSWSEKIWPLLLIPFAVFIAYAADPEVWILRTMTLHQAFADPAIAEHQFGAFLVLILVWLGWRDRKKPAEFRPLGYALPVLMIGGSLLLLGHAHSALTTTEELTNLINVQHAVFGTLGLLAGVVRWLQLRGLFPDRVARVAWPGLVIALGLFMAFFYREVV